MPDAPSILQNGPNASSFITTLDGESTALIKLKNQNGISVALTNYGARIVSIKMPDKSGNIADIVLGYDSIDKYLSSKNPYFGAEFFLLPQNAFNLYQHSYRPSEWNFLPQHM